MLKVLEDTTSVFRSSQALTTHFLSHDDGAFDPYSWTLHQAGTL